MDLVSNVRNSIEKIHLEYLTKSFKLQVGKDFKGYDKFKLNNCYPDLFNDGNTIESVFELKSRTYPRKQGKKNRPKKDFCWWTLNPKQIERYQRLDEQDPSFKLYWILLLGETEKRLKDTRNLREDSVIRRDVYVLPWNAYKIVEPSPCGNRNLGIKKVKDNFKFNKSDIHKGILFMTETIEDKVGKYFF